MKFIRLISLLCVFMVFTVSAVAQESTTLVVRAKAKDAKFIGTSMGGAFIKVINTETGEVLAQGLTKGSTGDTRRLVTDPVERYEQLSTEGSAKFETQLKLTEPVFATIEARAPGAQKQAQVISSTQLWLIPGHDITGDGVILEIPGFAVDVLEPRVHSRSDNRQVTIRANVVMMCGCSTSDGGTWDSSDYDIGAFIKQNGEVVDTIPLEFTGTSNLFEGTYSSTSPGVLEIIVYAFDAKTGNTGVDKTTVIVK